MSDKHIADQVMSHDARIKKLETWRKDVEAQRMPLPDRIALYGTLFLVVLQMVLR